MIKLKELLKEEKTLVVERPEKMKQYIDKFKQSSDGRAVSLKANDKIWMRADLVDIFTRHLKALINTDTRGFGIRDIKVEKLDDETVKFNKCKVSIKTLVQLIKVANHMLK